MKSNPRIVSLLPGATEWVCALGLQQRLVGVSHECDFPDAVNQLPRVTRSRIPENASSIEIDKAVRQHSDARISLYELDEKVLLGLRPDLILTQSLCNVCAVSERDVLSSIAEMDHSCGILDLSAQSFAGVMDDAKRIVEATGQRAASAEAVDSLQSRIDRVRQQTDSSGRPKVTLLEWTDPLFCAGHWTPELIQWAGGDDPIGIAGQPSRRITEAELEAADPDLLLVAACGLSEQRTRSDLQQLQQKPFWQRLRCVQESQVHAFDGSAFFNRAGPRLVDALERVAMLVNLWQQETK
ncbi:MAG: cobalamin-binding protein [Rubripirellula sp.]